MFEKNSVSYFSLAFVNLFVIWKKIPNKVKKLNNRILFKLKLIFQDYKSVCPAMLQELYWLNIAAFQIRKSCSATYEKFCLPGNWIKEIVKIFGNV